VVVMVVMVGLVLGLVLGLVALQGVEALEGGCWCCKGRVPGGVFGGDAR